MGLVRTVTLALFGIKTLVTLSGKINLLPKIFVCTKKHERYSTYVQYIQ